MPLQRLKKILNQTLTVSIDSSQDTVDRIQGLITARQEARLAKGKPALVTKTPSRVPELSTTLEISIRPIDLLRKIGDLTTPAHANMARLSASWATRRYFWAIAEATGQRKAFRLSKDAREIDFHQKTLLSDEFGIGFGGLVLEKLFAAPSSIDMSYALRLADQFQNIKQMGSAQPDYLFWNRTTPGRYFVVECKGCQTNRGAVINQLRRGMEQVPSITFDPNAQQAVSLVVATHLKSSMTTVYVVDPPPTSSSEGSSDAKGPVLKRTGRNDWKVVEAEAFAKQVLSFDRAKLLNWAGLFRSSSELLSSTGAGNPIEDASNDRELTSIMINNAPYLGITAQLFSDLGVPNLRIFTGVRKDVLTFAKGEEVHGQAEVEMQQQAAGTDLSPYTSVSDDGRAFVLLGL